MAEIAAIGARTKQHIMRAAQGAIFRVTAHMEQYWLVWLVLAFVAVASAIGLETGFERLYSRWRFAYNHSFLVFPMAAWLLLVATRGACITRIGPSVLGMLGLAAAVATYALAEALDFTLGMQAAVPLILYGVIAGVIGLQFAWSAVVPVGFLYFTVPVWDLMNGILQDISTAAVSALLRLSDVTAHIDLYHITIPSGTFEIAEGCSGLRYVLVSLILSVFYSMNWLQLWRTRFLLVSVATLTSMVANWVRIYTLILIGHWTQMEHYLIQVSHDEYGWVIFIVVMTPLLLLGRWLEGREPPCVVSGRAAEPRRASAPAFLMAGVIAAALTASPMLLGGGPPAPAQPRQIQAVANPAQGWSKAPPTRLWSPSFVAPHIVSRQALVGADRTQVDVYVARYLSKRFDSKLIASRNELAPGWRLSDVGVSEVTIGGEARTLRTARVKAGGDYRLLWSWYVIGTSTAHKKTEAKLLQIPALLAGRWDGAVIAVSAPCGETCADAEDALAAFLAEHGARLEAVARGAADHE